MRATDYIFRSRLYFGDITPPDILEDVSRNQTHGVFKGTGKPDWKRLDSGLWVQNYEDSTTDSVTISFSATVTSPYTVKLWARTDQTPSVRGVNGFLCDGGSINTGCFTIVSGTDRIYFYNGTDVLYTATDPTFTDWNMFVAVVNGASSAVYLNDGSPATGTMSAPALTTFYFGRSGNDTVWHDGDIALQDLINYALTSDEIYSIFQNERGWFGK